MSGKRAIFEEVGEASPQAQVASTGMIDKGGSGGARRAVMWWLLALAVLVAAMILLGGATRLTDSGLSITEWAPIRGILPPLSEAAWEGEFAKYREIPEFRLQNNDMDLAAFKGIYWWEWAHRALGRAVGLVWAVGFFGFLIARKLPRGWEMRLALPGVLGGVQGALGWWMVSSGLKGEMLDVASYRLALHLGLAFAILGLLLWYALNMARPERELMQARRSGERRLFGLGTGLMHFAFLQILLGALVAGIDAGRTYTDWPLMAGGFLPPDLFAISPWWRNFFEDAGLVQFMHRMSGYLLLVFGVVAWRRGQKSAHPRTRFAFNLVLALLLLQVVLGVVTLLYSAQLHVALTHQFGAILLWAAIINARFLARTPRITSLRGN